MEGAAPVGQSPQEMSKESLTDSTSTLPYSHDVSKPPSPCSSPVVLIPNSPDIPIKVEYFSDPISVPTPLFHLQGYPSSTSTPCCSSTSTLHVPSVIDNPALTNPSGQDVPYSVPLLRPTPIIGSFSMPSQTLADSYPSSSLSLDMLPPLSSSITHDQNLSSCSFVTPKIIPPSVSTLPLPCNTLSPGKPKGGHPVRGKSSRGHSFKDRFSRGRGRASKTLSRHSSCSNSSSHYLSFPSLHPYLPRDICLGRGHWIYLPDLRSVVTYLRILQLTPSLLITPALPKSFLP